MILFTSSFKNKLLKERVIVIIPILIVILCIFHRLAPASDGYRIIENNSFWKKKTFDNNKYDIVICGDSRVYRGVSPGHMKEVLPDYRIVNFGYGSAGYGDLMIREVTKRIDFSSKKSTVVLGITPLTLTHEGEKNYHLQGELKTTREELIELLYFKKVQQFFVPYTLSEISRSLKGKKFHTLRKQEYIDDGWVATYEEKPWEIAALKSYSTRFTGNQVLERNINRLAENVALWSKKGVKVFAFRPPTTHKMVELEDSLSGFNEAAIRVRLEKEGAIFLDFNIDDYTTSDGSHLQKESAIKFSIDMARKMQAAN